MHLKRLFVGLLALAFTSMALPALAKPPPNISYTVGICDPWFPSRCTQAGPFVPDVVSTASLAVSTVTGNVALPGSGQTVILTNNGATDISLKLGGSTVTATAGDFFLGAGRSVQVLRGTSTYVAAVTAADVSTLIVQTGNGTASFGGGGGGASGLSNYALESGGNLALSKTDLDGILSAMATPAGILGTNGSTIAAPTNGLDVTARGAAASGATVAGNPLLDGCRAATAAPTAVADGQAIARQCGAEGANVTRPYAIKELMVRGSTGAITNTTQTSIIASAGGSLRNYITAIQCANSGATTSILTFTDDAATILINPNGSGGSWTFPIPLRTAAATAFQVTPGSSSSSQYCSAQGYTGL